jgi:hypothetical protein
MIIARTRRGFRGGADATVAAARREHSKVRAMRLKKCTSAAERINAQPNRMTRMYEVFQ